MGIFDRGKPPVVKLVPSAQPKLVQKSTGKLFILVRDDVSENGKLYVAPLNALTSMRSIRPEAFKEEFDWYVEPSAREVLPARTILVEPHSVDTLLPLQPQPEAPVAEVQPQNRGGRPKGSKNKKPRKRITRPTPTV